MKRKYWKSIIAVLTVLTCVVALAACSKSATKSSTVNIKHADNGDVIYPIQGSEQVVLKYWVNIDSYLSKFISNRIETDIAKEIEKRTGVKVEYIHPPAGADNVKQAFNIMIASRDLPDIIEYNINNSYPGGPEKALKDGIIIPLNDIAPKYSPDMLKLLDKKADSKKYCMTNSGKLVMYPAEFKESETFLQGPMIRGDVLDSLGLSVPETMSEWYTTLKKMRDEGNIKYPLSWSEKAPKIKWSGIFTSAYDVVLGPWQKDSNNKIQFGAALPAYKDFLIEMNKWYKEKLIDPEFVSQDRNALRAKIADGKVGSFIDAGSAMTTTIRGWRQKDPNTKKVIVGAPFPVLNKGDKVRVGAKTTAVKLNNCAVITTASKYPELAAAWLNFGYTDEGAKFFNYGIGGKSYTIQNGKAVAADFIARPSANITKETEALNWTIMNGPFKALPYFIPKTAAVVPEIIDAIEHVWVNVSDDNSLRMPELPPNADDASRYAAIYTEIDTYVDEMFVKFITGQESLDNFDQYVKQLESMGLAECAKIQQVVLDGWNKR